MSDGFEDLRLQAAEKAEKRNIDKKIQKSLSSGKLTEYESTMLTTIQDIKKDIETIKSRLGY